MVVPFLMVCFDRLNHVASTPANVAIGPKLEKNMSKVGASTEEFSRSLVTGELYLFKKLSILSFACANPLAWRLTHEGQFPNVGFLVKQILGIMGSPIEIELVFNLARVLIALRCCRLQLENVDRIITVVKNWLDDAHANCKPNLDFQQYLKAKESLAKKNYNLIEEHIYIYIYKLEV